MSRFVVLFALVSLVACAEEGATVNRVQPNVLDKAIFAGEWYQLQTVIDTPYSTAFTFVGEQSLLEKVRWEIDEHFLIARRSYEWIDGSEYGGEGIRGESETSTAIAVYAIESHFDIRREYNTVTGEEMNVLVENETDRPWYQRRFMRVDWSRNLVTDTNLFQIARVFDGIEMEPVAYYVQDPEHPDAPKFERDADGAVHYIDIVNKAFVQPGMVEIEGWGSYPACWLLGQEHLDCAPDEVTVRNAFLRVDPDRDYQPWHYTGDRMDKFGYFVNNRAGYDPAYGPVESARFRFINRHDLWQASHRRGPDGALVECTTDAECDDGRGSVCDLDLARANRTDVGACTIPYRDRAVRAIAYHLSRTFPEDLAGDAEHVISDWASAFEETIDSLRENECLAHGGEAGACAAERDRADAIESLVMCHHPVAEDDHDACGEPGTVAEIGDLRYSLLGWVNEPNWASPLGYGPSAADPETGELIQANAFIYGAEVEYLAAYARDLVALLNGDVTEEELSSGAVADSWVDIWSAEEGRTAGRESASGHVVDLDGADVERVAAAMDFSWARPAAGTPARPRPANHRELQERLHGAAHRIAERGGYGRDPEHGAARLHALVGSSIERAMAGDDVRLAAGLDPRMPVDEDVLDLASPIRGMSMSQRRALSRARRMLRAERCVLGREFADDGLLGLARAIARTAREGGTMEWYGRTYTLTAEDGSIDYDAVRDMLRHPIFEGTMAHEVGHTLGLRHNFSGSYDSINYGPEYWQLRNDGSMRPRAFDPLTDAEIDGRIREHQTSTVMDYGNNFVVTDAAGIGHYDRAAIKMGYGDLVEVFSNAADPHVIAHWNLMQRYGWSVILTEDSFYAGNPIEAHPYTEFPELLGGVDRMEQRTDVPFTSLEPEEAFAMEGIEEPLVDAGGRPEVPYRFCSDEQSDLDPSCSLYDAGADAYESIQSVIDQYWEYYILSAFRRGRLDFEIEPYWWRILERYFWKLQSANQVYALDRSFIEDIWYGDPTLDAFWTAERGYASWTLGAAAAYSIFTRVITTPEPGTYGAVTRGDGSEALMYDDYADPVAATVQVPYGRYLETTWNFDAGYYWFDQLERAGFFYDKIAAIQVLTDPETFFVGKDTASDVRGYALNFHTTFAPSMTSFFRGVIAEEWSSVGPREVAGAIVWPDPLQIAEGDMPGTPIDPNAGFTIQLYAAVFGMALVPMTYDHDFLNRSRVWVRGGPEGVELDPTVPYTEFTDPGSGITYVARSYPDARGRETGIGARMLLRANLLARGGPEAAAELGNLIENLDVMRALTWELGFGSGI